MPHYSSSNLPTTKTRGASSNILRPAPTPSFHTISAFNLAAFFCLWPTWNLGVGCLKAAKSWRWIGKKNTRHNWCGWVEVYKFFGCLKFSWSTWKKRYEFVYPETVVMEAKPTRPWLFGSIQFSPHSSREGAACHLSPFFNFVIHQIVPSLFTEPCIPILLQLLDPGSSDPLPSKVDPPILGHPNDLDFRCSTPSHSGGGGVFIYSSQIGKWADRESAESQETAWPRSKMRSESLLDWNLKLIFFRRKFFSKKKSCSSSLYVKCQAFVPVKVWQFVIPNIPSGPFQHFPLNFLIQLFPSIWIFSSHTIVEWIEHVGSKKRKHYTETESWNISPNTMILCKLILSYLFYQSKSDIHLSTIPDITLKRPRTDRSSSVTSWNLRLATSDPS